MEHPEQHYLIVGQRGMGKTTFLLRLKYGIEDSLLLNNWLIPVSFTEEQYQVSELANLWEYVGEYLEDYSGFTGLYSEMERHSTKGDFEEQAYGILESALKQKSKKLVLLIDNIGDLFNKLEKKEIHRLREILQTKKEIRIIGGSTNYMEGLLDYHQPFYEFFKIMRLDSLSKEETTRLILQFAELKGERVKIEQIIKEAPGRIETLRILTGGVPRTTSIMFRIFLNYEHEHALKDLDIILDVVTPLYKHRMDDLPKQQQKIIDAVARNWEPISVKELAAKTRLISKTLSAQLNLLEKEEVVIKNNTSTRNKTYLIKERFWNIWYLMRYGRKDDKEKVIWLVKFLESWLSDDDIKKSIDLFVERVKNAEIDEEQLVFFSKVYTSLTVLPLSSKLKLKSIEKEIREEIKLNNDELYRCSVAEFEKGNFFGGLVYLSAIEDFKKREFDILVKLSFPEIIDHIMESLSITEKGFESGRVSWIISILLLIKVSIIIFSDSLKIEMSELMLTLRRSFEIVILTNQLEERTYQELYFSTILAIEIFRNLISKGLYNSILKIMEEVSAPRGEKTVFLKDQWRPFYLAIKYLHEPEELEKQPSELKFAAISIVERLLSNKSEWDSIAKKSRPGRTAL